MKTSIHFFLTCLIAFFAFGGALSMRDNPWPGLGIAFGIWAIFFWRVSVRLKRQAARREYEEWMFREHMRRRGHGRY